MEREDSGKVKRKKNIKENESTPNTKKHNQEKVNKNDSVNSRVKIDKKSENSAKITTKPFVKRNLTKPGNKRYLSYYVFQDEWRPTTPLREIAALETGPGPAVANLPSTLGDQGFDLRRPKAPSYKIGERDQRQLNNSGGPGPGAYDTRNLTNKGKEECHAAKVGGRIEELKPFETPGPAAYDRGGCDAVIFPHSPAYSMRRMTETGKSSNLRINSPAPDSYTLPSSIGSGKSPFSAGPAFTMLERLDKTGEQSGKSPGPGTYQLPPTNSNKQKPPAYSMGMKTFSQLTGTETPGPASNELHMVKFHKYSTPRFTFGIRHSPFKTLPTFATGD